MNTHHITDTIQYAVSTCKAVFDHAALKCAGALGLVGISFAFNDITNYVVAAIFFLTILDAITALMATKITGVEITSRKFSASIVKMFVYGILVAGGSLVEIVLGFNPGLNEIMAAFIALREFISIIENLGKMGYVIPKKLLNTVTELENKFTK